MAFVLGITGGIGTGKSTVLRMFSEMGAETLSADDVARNVLRKCAPAYHEVVERFGEIVVAPDGEINRRALAELIFSDQQARSDLDAITHPRIISEISERIGEFREKRGEGRRVMAVEIPLLLECGLQSIVDEVLVVAAEQGTQVSRLTSRSEISTDEALRRIESQMPMERKVELADRVIWNDQSLECLRQSVERVWREIRLL